MKRVKNDRILKEINRFKINFHFGIIFLIIAIILTITCLVKNFKKPTNAIYFNDIITSNYETDNNTIANLEIAMKPIKFTTINKNTDLYITKDNKYYYIIALTPKDYEKLINHDVETKALSIYGSPKNITPDIKEEAIKFYNKKIDSKNPITNNSFFSKFGNLYLDTTKQNISLIILSIIDIICYLLSLTFIIRYLLINNKINKALNIFSNEELLSIEDEIENRTAIHYEKAHLILTYNYVMTFINGLNIIRYNDIIWLYESILETEEKVITRGFKLMTKNGKNITFITPKGIIKSTRLICNNIINNILSKNYQILTGDTEENKEKAQEIINLNSKH